MKLSGQKFSDVFLLKLQGLFEVVFDSDIFATLRILVKSFALFL